MKGDHDLVESLVLLLSPKEAFDPRRQVQQI